MLNVAQTPNRLTPRCDFARFCDFAHHKKKETPCEHIMQDFLALQEKYNDLIEFYTDNSKTQEHTGSAIVSKHAEPCIKLP